MSNAQATCRRLDLRASIRNTSNLGGRRLYGSTGGELVEAQTDIQTYLEQGKQALAQGKAREAAIAYAHGAQLEPNTPEVHLGLAEANLALGNYGVVHMACRRVQELQPEGGLETQISQALIDLLDRRYERALQNIDAVISEDPGIAYAHAMRGYLLRAMGQDYDANLARSRAARLSFGGRFDNCFPPLEPASIANNRGYSSPSAETPVQENNNGAQAQKERDSIPSWSPPGQMRRQVIRTRFALSQYPYLVTNILIAINVIVHVLMLVTGGESSPVFLWLVQYNPAVMQGEYWRLFTSMFLHDPTNILHLALNMLSLFFVGRFVEVLFGKWRYIVIYLLSGLAGNVLYLFLDPNGASLGASGAIFGIFGAMGVFYLMNRRSMGPGMLSNWVLWLSLNLILGFVPGSNIDIWGHIGGLVSGMIIAFLLIPRQRRGRYI
jgi:membrane associated rhomboid family serine protease